MRNRLSALFSSTRKTLSSTPTAPQAKIDNQNSDTQPASEPAQPTNVSGSNSRLDDADDHVSIQIMSDLHLEAIGKFNQGDLHGPGYEMFDCTPSAPVLALLGDIGLTVQDGLFVFLKRLLSQYEKVFFIMGNHEYFRTTYDDAKARMTAFAAKMQHKRLSTKKGSALGEFIVLDQTRYDLTPNITILGCTLWSHIPPGAADTVRLLLNDFKRITGNWNVETHNAAHLSDAEWLDAQCALIKNEEPGRRVVIFTHHAPMIEGTSKPAHSHSDLNTAFATDMTGRACWDEGTPVKVWAFGHTHFNCDFVKNGVRVVSNQRGYEAVESPRTGFQEDFVLNV